MTRGSLPVDYTGAVSSMTDSIQRNPDAMMLLNTLCEKGSYELGRAMDTSILMITFGRFLQFPKDRLEVLGLAGTLLVHSAPHGDLESGLAPDSAAWLALD